MAKRKKKSRKTTTRCFRNKQGTCAKTIATCRVNRHGALIKSSCTKVARGKGGRRKTSRAARVKREEAMAWRMHDA